MPTSRLFESLRTGRALPLWALEPDRVSAKARLAIEEADELAVAAVTWYELAWLARHERIIVSIPVRSWLQQLAGQLRTFTVTPAIADSATALPSTFPGDPADRMIYATALEQGIVLVTKDGRIRDHDRPKSLTVW